VPRTEGKRERGLPHHARPGDFLIVSRNKGRLTIYARKLQQYGVPHLVTGGTVLNEVPELELLHICLSAVARSDDPVALVAALRSELFGIADTVLYEFRRLGGQFSYHGDIPADLPTKEAVVLRDAFDRLSSYSRWLRRMPTVAAIERIAADLGLIARACAGEEGDAHAGSLLKAIELLRSVDDQSIVGDYVGALARLVDQAEQYDGIPVRPPGETPVRVMNLHQCKGLEAPFVFLVDPSGESVHDVGVHIDRSTDRPRGYLPIYGPKRSQWGSRPLLAHPRGWDRLAAEEQKYLDAETNRLLYVAATRAGVKLVISQRDVATANAKNPWQMFDGYLQSTNQLADPGPVSSKPPVEVKADAADWKNEIATIEGRWQAVARPTYAVQAVKESATRAGPKPHGADKGGAEWGTVLHTLLEAAMKRPGIDLHGLALSLLEEENLPLVLANDVVSTVERVMDSALWRRATAASICLTEIPMGTLASGKSDATELPTVRRGVIDLVFREPAGWAVVDYKTERVDVGEIPSLVTYYRPQVEAYGYLWESIVGQPVAERGLFFTQCGSYVPI
jgi:ATP-dependent helicase/nuclease subunit A